MRSTRSTVSAETGNATHNTRHAAKRRPVVPTESNARQNKSKKKAKTAVVSKNATAYVVLPSIWVHDVEPLITDSRQEAEERRLEFDKESDYVFHANVSTDIAEALVSFNKGEREKHALQSLSAYSCSTVFGKWTHTVHNIGPKRRSVLCHVGRPVCSRS